MQCSVPGVVVICRQVGEDVSIRELMADRTSGSDSASCNPHCSGIWGKRSYSDVEMAECNECWCHGARVF